MMRSDGSVQRLDGIDSARLQRCPALWVEEGRIRRRVELDIGGAFVDQRLDFVPHDGCDILEHVANRLIELVGYSRLVAAYRVLHRRRRADFKRTRRVLLQERPLVRSKAAFLPQFSADDQLEIAFLGLLRQLAAGAAPFEAHSDFARNQTIDGLGDVRREDVAPVFAVGKDFDTRGLLQLERLENRAIFDLTKLPTIHLAFTIHRSRLEQLRRAQQTADIVRSKLFRHRSHSLGYLMPNSRRTSLCRLKSKIFDGCTGSASLSACASLAKCSLISASVGMPV